MKKVLLLVWLALISGIYFGLESRKPKSFKLAIGKCFKVVDTHNVYKIVLVVSKGEKEGFWLVLDSKGDLSFLIQPKALTGEQASKFDEFKVESSEVNCDTNFRLKGK